MENLDKLTKAGVPVFDCNTEKLEATDWYASRPARKPSPPPIISNKK
jgi:hypothetical protein